jgi:polyhydroxyalkanoate synthesis regulator phasin
MRPAATVVVWFGLGVAFSVAMGAMQPGDGAVTLEQRVMRIESGLFRRGSVLPTDPNRSMEQMLEEQSARIGRLERTVGAIDDSTLDRIETQVEALDGAIARLGSAGVSELSASVESLRRKMEDVERALGGRTSGPMYEIDRSLRDIRRMLDDPGSSGRDTGARRLDAIERQLDDLERQLDRIERKLD